MQHFVYSSVGSAHRNTGIPHFENKWRVEETVRSLDFPSYTILRPVFFMENFLSPWFKPGLDEGKLTVGLQPTTVLQMIAVRDIGKYGAWAFDNYETLNGRALDIAGDARTMPDTARIIGEAAGRKIEFVPTPIEEVRKFSEDFALMLEWFDAVGYEADIKKIVPGVGNPADDPRRMGRHGRLVANAGRTARLRLTWRRHLPVLRQVVLTHGREDLDGNGVLQDLRPVLRPAGYAPAIPGADVMLLAHRFADKYVP